MKTKRTLASRVCLFGIGILMLLARPHAAQAATCIAIASHADGRVLGP